MGKVHSSARHPASEAKSLARDFAKKASVRHPAKSRVDFGRLVFIQLLELFTAQIIDRVDVDFGSFPGKTANPNRILSGWGV
jgi:hypothetical protein